MLCVPWQTVHSAIPKVSKARLCGLRTKRSRVALGHCAQTLATEATPGGAAPWLPWQSLHAGAWRLPRRSSPCPWTLSRYSANCVVGMPYGFIRAVSLWQRAHVAGTLVEKTGEVPSLTGRTGCTPWQLIQTATRRAPLARRWPCLLGGARGSLNAPAATATRRTSKAARGRITSQPGEECQLRHHDGKGEGDHTQDGDERVTPFARRPAVQERHEQQHPSRDREESHPDHLALQAEDAGGKHPQRLKHEQEVPLWPQTRRCGGERS